MAINGAQAILNMLADAGVSHLFGNPGTTELPISDALVDHDRIRYILGLQEVPVMAMADGYAQASGSVGVVNLHISCGLGNAMGMLYNAHRAGSPLLVTAGQQDRRLSFSEPVLWGDMVQVARPWTKWAAEVNRVQDIPTAIRRAVQTALMPPTGPVFLSIPLDVQLEAAEMDLTPPRPLNSRIRPPVEELRRAAELLAQAENPGIVVGSRVVEADAVNELVRVAELVGAPVMSESGTSHGRLSFPCDHPLSAPGLPVYAPQIFERIKDFDVLFFVGMGVFQLYVYYEPERPIGEGTRLIHLDQSTWELGKNYPMDVAIAGDPKTGLAELAELLQAAQTSKQQASAGERSAGWAEVHQGLRAELQAQLEAESAERPMTPVTFMDAVARVLPDNVAVVEEAVTTTRTYLERVGAIKDPAGYFAHRGWALGWGLGCSIGVQLAWPQRPVLALIGEGAAMYGIQALWTAARYKIPVTFVICNNAQYQILKGGAAGMQLPHATQGQFEGMDLTGPEIDMVQLARSLGLKAERITEPDVLSDKLRESLAADVPRLFDVSISRKLVPI